MQCPFAFFDDDFIPAPTYLAEIERGFMAWSDIAMASEVVADGIIAMGLEINEARRLLGASMGRGLGQADVERLGLQHLPFGSRRRAK